MNHQPPPSPHPRKRPTLTSSVSMSGAGVGMGSSQSPTSPKPTSSYSRRRRSLRSVTEMGGDYVKKEEELDDGDMIMMQADQELVQDDIEIAMRLLSIGTTDSKDNNNNSNGAGAGWPDPEDLLKESLRYSLNALRTLRHSKRIISDIQKGKRNGNANGNTADGGIMEVEACFENVLVDMKGAKEVLAWAENQMEQEQIGVRERVLKG
ncbi:hypothetical protein BZA77DRAFT_357265 [Pyronema omphalodes]|nr:hypothetical protein BZA77DRAFT_357265 [Pyronema omphalodes]